MEFIMKNKFFNLVSAGILLSISSLANAGLIMGDFRTESDLPSNSSGSLVFESLAQNMGSGYELDGSNFMENPSNWIGGVVHMDYDTATGVLLLDSQDIWNFETFDALISNISFDVAGEYISGIVMLDNNLVEPGMTPVVTFDENNISISYFANVTNQFDFTNGSASFQVYTSAPAAKVPEPSTLAVFALGLMGLASRRFKKQA
jgi:hypothetical protein